MKITKNLSISVLVKDFAFQRRGGGGADKGEALIRRNMESIDEIPKTIRLRTLSNLPWAA